MPQPRKTANLSDSVRKHLDMYALAASAAGVSLLALSPSAEARIVYTRAHDYVFPIFLDLNHDGIADFLINSWAWGFSSSTGSNGLQAYSAGSNAGSHKNQIIGKRSSGSYSRGWAYALRAGARVGPAGPFVPVSESAVMAYSHNGGIKGHKTGGYWANGGKGVKNRYLGLKFQIKGKTHYGWARLNVTMPGSFGTLTGYAYETIANKPIIAGKTHGKDVITLQDGASLGALAAGTNGLHTWRQK